MAGIKQRSPVVKNHFGDRKPKERQILARKLRSISTEASTVLRENPQKPGRNPVPYCLKRNIERVAEIASFYGDQAGQALDVMASALYSAINTHDITNPDTLREKFISFYQDVRATARETGLSDISYLEQRAEAVLTG